MKPTKPDYGNWVPLAMMKAMGALAFLLLFATLLLASLLPSPVPLYAPLPPSLRF